MSQHAGPEGITGFRGDAIKCYDPEMRTRIGVRGRDYDLLSPGDTAGAGTVLRFRDDDDALVFLRHVASEPLALMHIRRELARIHGAEGTTAVTDRDALQLAARLLATGRLRFSVVPVPVGGGGGSADPRDVAETTRPDPVRSFGSFQTPSSLTGRARTESPQPSMPPVPPSQTTVPPLVPAKQSTTHWIEIELLGEDDRGIPEERFSVRLPTGRTVTGKLDATGFARIEWQGTGGDCQICFPDLDQEAWSFIGSVEARAPSAASTSA